MEPLDFPFRATPAASCCSCDGPLEGNRWNCPACIRAEEIAAREARGQVVTPAMVAAVPGKDEGPIHERGYPG